MNFTLLSLMAFIGVAAQAEQWNGFNNPNNFNVNWHPTNYNSSLSALPTSGAVPLEKTPWSDSYWPKDRGAFAFRWLQFENSSKSPEMSVDDKINNFFRTNHPSEEEVAAMSENDLKALSPLEKYSIYIGDYSYSIANQYLKFRNANAEYWEGYCHAWSAAAAHYAEPLPVTMPITANGVTKMLPFGSGDIKALLVANYAELRWSRGGIFNTTPRVQIRTIGQMCHNRFMYPTSKVKHGREVMADYSDTDGLLDGDLEKSVNDYQNKANRLQGTPIDSTLASQARAGAEDDACRDVNAGAFHIVMANQLGIMREGFLMDKTRDMEVWNQPISSFTSTIDGYEAPSSTSAAGTARVAIVTTNLTYADDTNYGWTYWNPTLAGIFGLKGYFTAFMQEYAKYEALLVDEGDLKKPNSYPEDVLATAHYRYKLDLDSNDNIIGGDWITMNRPDDLYIVKKEGFVGNYDHLGELYRPMKPEAGRTTAVTDFAALLQ